MKHRLKAVTLVLALLLGSACTPEEIAWWQWYQRTPEGIEEIIHRKFGPLGLGSRFVEIARCESELKADAVNPKSGASGVLQIHPFWNKPWHSDPVAQYVGSHWHLRFDPNINVEMAYRIWESYGIDEWECA